MIIAVIIACAVALGLGVGCAALRAKLEVARARLADALSDLTRQRGDLANLQVMFKGISSEILKESRDEFLKQAAPAIAERVRPLEDALRRYDEALKAIEAKRGEAYGGLASLLKLVQTGQAELTRETGGLAAALKSPTARGRWGEVTLRRVVEIAGMSRHCDFDLQATVEGEEGRQRPDMIVHLPGGRTVVVDSKAPINDYTAAIEAADEAARARHLAAHAQRVRDHMRRLGAKSYWSAFDPAPDFVVLFLPGECFFSAALEMDRALIEDGMASRVILATPTTLIVLLRSVAMGWQQEELAVNSQRISEAGKELFERCATFARHLGEVGSGLERAIKSFNAAVGSWESRVVPGAKRLKELGAARSPDAKIEDIQPVETAPRQALAQVDTPADT